jgi:hypothetical protein
MWVVDVWDPDSWLWRRVGQFEQFTKAEALVQYLSRQEQLPARAYRDDPGSTCGPSQTWITATTAG